MCEFYSAIVLRNGDFVDSPDVTDSHEYLIRGHRLPSLSSREPEHMPYVRVECSLRDGGDYCNHEDYSMRLDEDSSPQWFDDEMHERAEAECRRRIKAMVLTEDRDILLGGCWIVPKGITVRGVIGGRIISLGGTVQKVWGGGTVQEVLDGGTVHEVRGDGRVQEVRRGGTVQKVWGGGTVHEVLDGGTVQEVWGGGTVQKVWGGGTVQKVWDGGKVQEVLDGGTVHEVLNGGTVIKKKQ